MKGQQCDHRTNKADGEYTIRLPKHAAKPTIQSKKSTTDNFAKTERKISFRDAGAVSKINHPTEWVISHFVVKKKNGSLGLCLDPKDLIILRDFKTISSPEKVSCKLHNKEY